MCITLLLTLVILDITTLHRHMLFMKRNIAHWMHKNGWIKRKQHSKKPKIKSTRRNSFQDILVNELDSAEEHHRSEMFLSYDLQDVSFRRIEADNLHSSVHPETCKAHRLPRIPIDQCIISSRDVGLHLMDENNYLNYPRLHNYNILDYGPFSHSGPYVDSRVWKSYDGYNRNINEREITGQTGTPF